MFKVLSVLSICAMASVAVTSPAQARTYNCFLEAQSTLKHQPAMPTRMRITLTSGGVSVADAFIRATGNNSVQGKLDRRIGKEQLFSWRVTGVPRKLMPQEVTWYRPVVNYRARLNTSNGMLSVRGDFVGRYSGAASGTDLRMVGACR